MKQHRPMDRPNRLVAVALGLLLFAAPIAWDCGEAAAMTSGCPMTHGKLTCHAGSGPAMECCAVQPASVPMPASLFQTAKLFVALELPSLPAAAEPAPRAVAPDGARAVRSLERFALFAAYLL